LIPATLARLSQQLALVAFHQTADTPSPFNPNDPLATASSLRFISATHRFRISQERTNYRRRGINSSMEPFGVTPGPVTTTITMERVVLQTEDAMGAFQFLPGNVAFQIRPLVIIEATFPAIGKDGQPTVRTNVATGNFGADLRNALGSILALVDIAKSPTYTNCWVSNSEIEYKLEGAQVVIQNVTLNAGRVSPAVSVVFPFTEATLITSMPIVTRGIQLAGSIGR
jgi:hypothetical protein